MREKSEFFCMSWASILALAIILPTWAPLQKFAFLFSLLFLTLAQITVGAAQL